MAKMRIFDSFGGCIFTINVKFGTGADIPVTKNQYASPPRGNAILAGPLRDSDEIFCR